MELKLVRLRIVNIVTDNWIGHPLFGGILIKPLLIAVDNALVNASMVCVLRVQSPLSFFC